MNTQEIPPYLNQIAQIIFDKKGSNILALDIRGISSLADFVIIAEGNVDKHVSAIESTIFDELKKVGFKPS
jgi:ribosome-associated protein